MTFLKKLFGSKDKPVQRVRICVECGMPVAEHKDWCSIYQTMQAMERKKAAGHSAPTPAPSES
ncbi:MAG: hypothetical protein ACM3NQ_19855 [Bacteroidales bacterium]